MDEGLLETQVGHLQAIPSLRSKPKKRLSSPILWPRKEHSVPGQRDFWLFPAQQATPGLLKASISLLLVELDSRSRHTFFMGLKSLETWSEPGGSHQPRGAANCQPQERVEKGRQRKVPSASLRKNLPLPRICRAQPPALSGSCWPPTLYRIPAAGSCTPAAGLCSLPGVPWPVGHPPRPTSSALPIPSGNIPESKAEQAP